MEKINPERNTMRLHMLWQVSIAVTFKSFILVFRREGEPFMGRPEKVGPAIILLGVLCAVFKRPCTGIDNIWNFKIPVGKFCASVNVLSEFLIDSAPIAPGLWSHQNHRRID